MQFSYRQALLGWAKRRKYGLMNSRVLSPSSKVSGDEYYHQLQHTVLDCHKHQRGFKVV